MAGDTLFTAHKAKLLSRGRFDIDPISLDAQISGDIGTHLGDVFTEPRGLSDHCHVNVTYFPPRLKQLTHNRPQQLSAVNAEKGRVSIRKVGADITQNPKTPKLLKYFIYQLILNIYKFF